jgi:glycosyltransferase involved in cell wall biosynthesis
LNNNCLNTENNNYLYWLYYSLILSRFRKILKFAHAALGYSDSQLELYNLYGIEKSKLFKSSVLIDIDSIKNPINLKKNKKKYFIIYGQQRKIKGWHLLKKIIKNSNNVNFKIAIHDEAIVDKTIKKWGLKSLVSSKKIQIISGLGWNELKNEISQSRGVVLPSYYNTTGEFSLIEAMGLKKPVIVFNVGFHSNYLKNGKNAMVSDIGDIDHFTRNIELLNDDDLLYEKISKEAYETFKYVTSSQRTKKIFNSIFH